VNEPEVIRALQDKRIAGAALDVYWNELYQDDSDTSVDPWVAEAPCKLDNVILAPHNGDATWDFRARKATSVARGMLAMIRGERAALLLNPEVCQNS
jgi:phosphoglycerate dehydrogenase-like enzyme